MTQYICTRTSNDRIQVCPLTIGHGAAELPEEIGTFLNEEGQVIEIRRTPTGPASYSCSGNGEHFQQQIRDVVQNCFWATANTSLDINEPLALTDGKICTAKSADAVLSVRLNSLSDFPDFVAHMSILKALYKFLGVQSDVLTLCNVASAMTVEEGMCLPITDELENTLIMKVRSPSEEPGCYNVTFYGPSDCTMPFRSGQAISRIATWKERGSEEFHSIKADIGEIV